MGWVFAIVLALCAFVFFKRLTRFRCKSNVCLVGKTALITGGASGIGYQIAATLASRGCRVIIADVIDSQKAVHSLITETHNKNIVGKKLDLASFRSVREFAADVNKTESRLDILINNAGIGEVAVTYTGDGLQKTMQVNFFGHFLLTHLLLDLIKKSAPSRIIFTSSIVAFFSDLTVDTLNPKKEYDTIKNVLMGGTYAASKVCQALAAKVLAEKLKNTTGVTVNAYHPGGTRTKIFYRNIKNLADFYRVFMGLFTWSYGKSPEEGAQTPLYLAMADEVQNTSGKFFMDGFSICFPFKVWDDDFCKKIWDRSVLYTKLEPHEIKC